jgi:hypothetical protein
MIDVSLDSYLILYLESLYKLYGNIRSLYTNAHPIEPSQYEQNDLLLMTFLGINKLESNDATLESFK